MAQLSEKVCPVRRISPPSQHAPEKHKQTPAGALRGPRQAPLCVSGRTVCELLSKLTLAVLLTRLSKKEMEADLLHPASEKDACTTGSYQVCPEELVST